MDENIPALRGEEGGESFLPPRLKEVTISEQGEARAIFSDGSEAVIMLTQMDTAFPRTEVIRPNEERPTKERIPSVARMDNISPSETVWLTNSAVKERLRVFLQTDPQFNLDTPIASTGYSRKTDADGFPVVLEGNRRNAISPQAMIKKFEEMGFAFSVMDGKVSMLVDAVIPAAQNANGRVETVPLGSHSTQKGDYYDKVIVAHDEGKRGFRPAVHDSTHAIAIPLEDILVIHREPPGMEHHSFRRDQSAENLQGRELMTASTADTISRIRNFFDSVRSNTELYPGIRERIQDVARARIWAEKKALLYDVLTELGMKPTLLDTGYFPYEPLYSFTRYPAEGEISAHTLKDLSQAIQRGEVPVELMLDELALALN